MNKLLLPTILLSLTAGATLADRAVTDDERAKLVTALQAAGCSGGKMEFDDGKFEVDNSKCADGRTYDLDFDASFNLIKKKLD
jgi:hypothetical protein